MNLVEIREKVIKENNSNLKRISDSISIMTKYDFKDVCECIKHLVKQSNDHDYVYRSINNNIKTYEYLITSISRFAFKDEIKKLNIIKEMVEEIDKKNNIKWKIINNDLDILKEICINNCIDKCEFSKNF